MDKSFKFDFLESNQSIYCDQEKDNNVQKDTPQKNLLFGHSSAACKETSIRVHNLGPEVENSDDQALSFYYDTLQVNELCSIQFVNEASLTNANIAPEVDAASSDIIAGLYEGGLKVWECSIDLCKYLYENYCKLDLTHADVRLSVLELGCGHGLPGCLLLKELKHSSVLFSDFNDYVIYHATMNNVRKNCIRIKDELQSSVDSSLSISQRTAFVSGDWISLSRELMHNNQRFCRDTSIATDGKFDLVLAAETTYTKAAAESTAHLFYTHVKFPHGVGIIATKRYYFGCGGGTDAFREALSKESGSQMRIETLETFDNGKGNIRELLKISWQNCK